jgi:hypothetical protein
MKLEQDVSLLVWIGCLALLFAAIAIHEGWFSRKANPILTSGTENADNPSGEPSVSDEMNNQNLLWRMMHPWG